MHLWEEDSPDLVLGPRFIPHWIVHRNPISTSVLTEFCLSEVPWWIQTVVSWQHHHYSLGGPGEKPVNDVRLFPFLASHGLCNLHWSVSHLSFFFFSYGNPLTLQGPAVILLSCLGFPDCAINIITLPLYVACHFCCHWTLTSFCFL